MLIFGRMVAEIHQAPSKSPGHLLVKIVALVIPGMIAGTSGNLNHVNAFHSKWGPSTAHLF